ncbi:unnamed protein product [Protopolystoma xenopodis]|uniref:Peptidase S1 domain-containing protein n=1 Tax=Protopolystoma xenopodis TaxID=117903 RepID=A0A448X0A6_9PLAT|nr:unnamed protein product [Protopolystoma xenopodis]
MVAISRIIRHPKYNVRVSYDFDIALVKLAKPINYTRVIQPVCLPFMDSHLAAATADMDTPLASVVPGTDRLHDNQGFTYYKRDVEGNNDKAYAELNKFFDPLEQKRKHGQKSVSKENNLTTFFLEEAGSESYRNAVMDEEHNQKDMKQESKDVQIYPENVDSYGHGSICYVAGWGTTEGKVLYVIVKAKSV